ncbi:ATP-binding cassette domain-containing protein [Brevibacillus sp. SYP-B805]|uniref:ABC transporter ATP-binding protein n=1 Tax=Brevibacillus sp. SYP-B805 TaxID=1578199 RepID=UPI0013ECE3DD|nr:ATP-binding cassette domain-containing protein [Brevibacillus sp. SYP-B805]NGQ95104.1 ATP-binding cassette domain-containing protein [Brevibacillus sp. SYP-B805]
MGALLELEHIGKNAGGGPGSWLFRDVNAVVAEPSIIHILGLSGQGKSTLLRIIGLLTPPDEGTVRLQARAAAEWVPEKWRSLVSYVAQHPVMLPGSVEENLRAVSRIHQQPFEARYARALMERVGLGELAWEKDASLLSGGEKQRVALVRTLLLRPRILLLDEVTASLDIHSQRAVEELLTHVHREDGVTLLWVTHHLEQARRLGDRIWFMAEKSLLEDAPAAAFFHSPRTEMARRFLQDGSMKEGQLHHV